MKNVKTLVALKLDSSKNLKHKSESPWFQFYLFFIIDFFLFTGHTALQAASQNGHLEVLRLLLRSGANLELEVNRENGKREFWDWEMDEGNMRSVV